MAPAVVKRSLIVVHRWLGVALCLIFLIWFPSGIGMMYWTYPSVSAQDRIGASLLTLVGAISLTIVGAILLTIVGASLLTLVGAIPRSRVGAIGLTSVGAIRLTLLVRSN